MAHIRPTHGFASENRLNSPLAGQDQLTVTSPATTDQRITRVKEAAHLLRGQEQAPPPPPLSPVVRITGAPEGC